MNQVEHIILMAGELPLAISATAIHSIHDGLRVQSEPDTQPWFLGLTVADGRLLPVTDLGALLNGKASHGRIIEVAHSVGLAALRVDSITGVCRAEPQTLEAPVDFPASGLSSNMSIYDNSVNYFVMDVAELVHSAPFNAIGLSAA